MYINQVTELVNATVERRETSGAAMKAGCAIFMNAWERVSIKSSSVASTRGARIFERTDVGLYQPEAQTRGRSNDHSYVLIILTDGLVNATGWYDCGYAESGTQF